MHHPSPFDFSILEEVARTVTEFGGSVSGPEIVPAGPSRARPRAVTLPDAVEDIYDRVDSVWMSWPAPPSDDSPGAMGGFELLRARDAAGFQSDIAYTISLQREDPDFDPATLSHVERCYPFCTLHETEYLLVDPTDGSVWIYATCIGPENFMSKVGKCLHSFLAEWAQQCFQVTNWGTWGEAVRDGRIDWDCEFFDPRFRLK